MTNASPTSAAPPSNGNGDLARLPLPVWAKTLVQIGGLSAIALYLTYMGAQTLPAMQRELILLNERAAQAEKANAGIVAAIDRLYVVTLQMCANQADSDAERDACFTKRD